MRPTWTRRELLQQGAFAAVMLTGPSGVAAASPLPRRRAPKTVVVLGAGLAGLCAAYELQQAGHEVTVLEARLRAGGRVYTLREPFSDGLYAEAGALFIPNHHTHTIRYARQFGLPLEPIPSRSMAQFYFVQGKRYDLRQSSSPDWPVELTPQERSLGLSGMWQRYIGSVVREMGDVTAPDWPPESLKKYDQMSFADFLKEQGASPAAISLLRLGYYDLWGDGVETVSALSLLRDAALRQAERQAYSIRGGNDLLPKALAGMLKERIHYGAVVTKIQQTATRVFVHYMQGRQEKRIAGERVVCALPFSCLRHVEVTPPFSPEKRRAVEELPNTSVVRVYLQSRQKFWVERGWSGMVNTDLPIMWIWEPTFNQAGPRGILESYTAGVQARRLTGMSDTDRLSYTLEQMEKVYPGLTQNYEGGASKSWDADEWSRGDYAWFKPGQMTALLPHIARPEGRLHFAGDHTSSWPGWMQGALASGLRVATEINAARD